VGRAGIEPDVEDVVDLLPVSLRVLAEEAFARAAWYQASAPSFSKASAMRALTRSS
jgi:hypothetical protein